VKDFNDLFDDGGPDDIMNVVLGKSKRARWKTTTTKAKNWFVQLPYPSILKTLAEAGATVAAVLVEIAHEAWYTGKRTVVVHSKPLREAGISRHAKKRALVRLACAGLIEIIDDRNGRNPTVQIKFKLHKRAKTAT
jgi:hypothetical protein